MDFNERTRTIGTWLVNLLKRYTPPAGLDDATLRDEMNLIVGDINSHIPSQYEQVDLDQTLGKIDSHVREIHGSRSWPTIKTFILATKNGVADYCRAIAVPKATTYHSNSTIDRSDSITISRVINGDGIPDYLLNHDSPTRQRLIASGQLTDGDFAKYIAPINT
jgi:hypothetical protein